MNKLHSFAFYALVTPAITLGAGSVLAQDHQERTDQDADRGAQSSERDQGATQSTPGTAKNDEKGERAGQYDAKQAEDRRDAREETRTEARGYMESAPADSMQASDLIGMDVKTAGDEELGSVNDLIIDENGQVVAIVVGIGGFLGIGEKDVAIGWGHVTTSGTADDRELHVDVTREELRSAPKFERRD